MCSSIVKKPSLMTPEMESEFLSKQDVTKLPTYTPGTGEKRLKVAQADYAKKNPIPQKKVEWPADAPKRGDAPEPKTNRQRFGKGF